MGADDAVSGACWLDGGALADRATTGAAGLDRSRGGSGIPSCQRAQVEERRKTSSVRLRVTIA